MAYSGQFSKQPSEIQTKTITFANRLASGETVSSIAVTAKILSSGATATSTMVSSSSLATPIATVKVKAGTSGVDYVITVKATTSSSNLHEADILMSVMES